MQMAENSRVHAPYNFVPFSSKVLIPYESVGDLPRHDELRTDLKSGEIHVTLQAKTPVFVSDGDPKKQNDSHFFRGANGKHMIPGSTVRGMVRENMQILGFGLIRRGEDLEDYQIYFREIAAATGNIAEPLKKYYADTLGIPYSKDAKIRKSVSIPQAVKSGYIRCKNGKYFILPAAEQFIRVSRKHKDVQCFGSKNARVVPVAYRAVNGSVKQILPVDQGIPGMQKGMLLYTGKPVGKVPNHLYLFSEEDPEARAIPVDPKDILSYMEDLESRANSLKAYYPVSFWELPKEGRSKPVFFVRHNGHLYFGMSLFLRIGYQYPLSEGLPKSHREMMEEKRPLDYPHAILGFATDMNSYRSRVSFGDFEAVGSSLELETRRAILSGPRPSYYPAYVVDGKNYNDVDSNSQEDKDRFQLRGYKQYWMKPMESTTVPEGKEKVGTVLRPLPEGTEFTGIICFQNLTDVELGLLLWSIRLEEGCFQTVGMGKPYGYGRMNVQIDSLRTLDYDRLYGSDLTSNPWKDETDQVARYIDAYDAGVLGTTGKKKKIAHVRDRAEIQDFFFLKRSVRDGRNETYMELKEYQNVREPLPTVRSIRESEEGTAATSAGSAPTGPVDPYEALRNKFKKL